jgi:hypothetical protein
MSDFFAGIFEAGLKLGGVVLANILVFGFWAVS